LYVSAVFSLQSYKFISSTIIDDLGRQVTYPINISGAYTGGLYMGNSFPLKTLKTTINTSTSLNLTRDFASANGSIGKVETQSLRQTIGFSYTHRQLFDLMFSGGMAYNCARYFLDHNASTDYADFDLALDGNLNLPLGITIGLNTRYILNTGRAQGYNYDQLLVNGMITKTLLPQSRGQLRVQVFDLLDRNISYNREITPGYIQDSRTNPLKRFIMIGFTYYIKPPGPRVK
jgi:hypothetical protein